MLLLQCPDLAGVVRWTARWGVPLHALPALCLSPERANLSQLQAPRDRTVRGVLHPWQPANLTLAKPSRCHCQVPGALCAVPWGRGHFRSLQSLFLRLFCLQGWLLFSSAHHHHHQHRTHCGSSTFTLFFSFFSSSCPKPSPHSASWFASFFLLLSRRCLSAQQAFCSAFAVPLSHQRSPSPSRLRLVFFSLFSPHWALRFTAHTPTFLTELSLSCAFTFPFSCSPAVISTIW